MPWPFLTAVGNVLTALMTVCVRLLASYGPSLVSPVLKLL